MTNLSEQFWESFVKGMGTASGTLAVMSVLGGVSMLVVNVGRLFVTRNVLQKQSVSSQTIVGNDEEEDILNEGYEETGNESECNESKPSKTDLSRFKRIFDKMTY
jgi:hypothetical protein